MGPSTLVRGWGGVADFLSRGGARGLYRRSEGRPPSGRRATKECPLKPRERKGIKATMASPRSLVCSNCRSRAPYRPDFESLACPHCGARSALTHQVPRSGAPRSERQDDTKLTHSPASGSEVNSPLSVCLKILGGIICAGLGIKIALIGFYSDELAVITVLGAIGLGLLWIGNRTDGW